MIVRFLLLTLLSQAEKATECKKQETLCNCIARGCSNGKFIDNQIKIVSEDTVTYNLSDINKNCSSIAPICKSLVHFSIEPKKVHCKQVISNSGLFPRRTNHQRKSQVVNCGRKRMTLSLYRIATTESIQLRRKN